MKQTSIAIFSLLSAVQPDMIAWNRTDDIFHKSEMFCFVSKAAVASSPCIVRPKAIVATGHSEPQLIAADTRLQPK